MPSNTPAVTDALAGWAAFCRSIIRHLHSLLCLIRPHKWRRLNKKELEQFGATSQHRICSRCDAKRIARQRKRSEAPV